MCIVRGGVLVCWCVRCGVRAESVCGVVRFVIWCCVVLCCVVMCDVGAGVGVQCVVCGVCSVCCLCVARLGTRKNPPCVDSKRPPCVRSKRNCVCLQHAHMLFSMWTWCRYTRGRCEPTHGEEGGGGSLLSLSLCPSLSPSLSLFLSFSLLFPLSNEDNDHTRL